MGQLETAFENTLFQRIPQTKNLGMQIKSIQPNEICVQGDFALNKNHLDIVFGGSIAAIAITSAWSLVQHNVTQAGLQGSLVIKHQEMDYLLPVKTAFECVAHFQASDDWTRFLKSYQEKGRARVTVEAQLVCEGKICAKFQGLFVLFK